MIMGKVFDRATLMKIDKQKPQDVGQTTYRSEKHREGDECMIETEDTRW